MIDAISPICDSSVEANLFGWDLIGKMFLHSLIYLDHTIGGVIEVDSLRLLPRAQEVRNRIKAIRHDEYYASVTRIYRA